LKFDLLLIGRIFQRRPLIDQCLECGRTVAALVSALAAMESDDESSHSKKESVSKTLECGRTVAALVSALAAMESDDESSHSKKEIEYTPYVGYAVSEAK